MVTRLRKAAVFLLLLGLAVPALADPIIPPLTGRVMDLAHVLDDRTARALTKQLADHEASTSNQVVVVTLPDLQDSTIEVWGRALLNGWAMGQREKNNGVVLVVAPQDRRLRIEVGYGLDDVLSASAASRIIETEIVPRFKGGDMRGGITAGVNAILATIAGTYQPLTPVERSSSSQKDIWSFAPFVIMPLIFIVTVVINIARGGISSRRGYNNCGTGYSRGNLNRGLRSSRFSSSGSSGGGGFSGGGGRGGGGGASGRW